MSFKILKVIFIILLLITLGEAGYYVYILGNKKDRIQQTVNNEIVQSPKDAQGSVKASDIPTSTPAFLLESEKLIDNFRTSTVIQFINHRGKNQNFTLYLEARQEGYIGVINKADSADDRYFTIIDEKGNKIATYLVGKDAENKFIFLKIVEDKKSPLSFNDLEIGDKIVTRYHDDLIDRTNSYKEFLIYEKAEKTL